MGHGVRHGEGRDDRAVAPLLARPVTLLVAIVACAAAGGGALAAPPLTDPAGWGTWAADRDAVVATVAVLRLVVLGMGWYLAGVTAIGALGCATRRDRLVRVAEALSVPVVRRLLRACLGIGVATTVVACSPGVLVSGARGSPRAAAEAPAGPAPPGVRPPPATPGPGVSATEPTGTPAPDATAPPVVPDTVTVEEGDHLWAIAARQVTAVRGGSATDAEVGAYWRRLVDANRGRLVDPDDADLVLPGQRFVLPEVHRP